MKFCLYESNEIGAVADEKVYEVGDALVRASLLPRNYTMRDFIEKYSLYPAVHERVEETLKSNNFDSLSKVKLRAPIYNPSAIWAAAANYNAPSLHGEDTNPDHPYAKRIAAQKAAGGEAKKKRAELPHDEIMSEFFMKPPASIIGPGESVYCPNPKAWIDVEMELAVVIGKKAKNVSENEALDYVFGYTILWDISQREPGAPASRSIRKGFDTYSPLGPWIVTKDEVKDPQNLKLKTWQNDVVTMDVNTNLMICSIPEQIRYLSHVLTLQPGDIITTGTPPGSSHLSDGVKIRGLIQNIGEMQLQFHQAKI